MILILPNLLSIYNEYNYWKIIRYITSQFLYIKIDYYYIHKKFSNCKVKIGKFVIDKKGFNLNKKIKIVIIFIKIS